MKPSDRIKEIAKELRSEMYKKSPCCSYEVEREIDRQAIIQYLDELKDLQPKEEKCEHKEVAVNHDDRTKSICMKCGESFTSHPKEISVGDWLEEECRELFGQSNVFDQYPGMKTKILALLHSQKEGLIGKIEKLQTYRGSPNEVSDKLYKKDVISLIQKEL